MVVAMVKVAVGMMVVISGYVKMVVVVGFWRW